MYQIIINEWRSLYRNRVLVGITIGFLAILMATVFLGIKQTNEQTERYLASKAHLRAQWESIKEMNPHGAAHYGTYAFKPTNLLSSLDDGVNSITGNVLRVEGHVQNEMVYSEASQSQSISKFGKLRSSLLLQYILPLLLIFLAFQAIHNEKQSGRLKILFIQGGSSSTFAAAKAISIWLYAELLLLITICTYVLLNLSYLSTDIVLRACFLFISYSLYYYIICALTVYLSLRLSNTPIALTTMLGVWIVWTVFVPNIIISSVEELHELPSREVFTAAMREDRSKGIDGHNPADQRSKDLEKRVLMEYGVDSLSQLPINFDGIVMQEDEVYGNKVWDKHFGALRSVMSKQKQSYQMGGIISPFISLQNASMGFAGTDNIHHQEFLLQVEKYRRVFIKTLNDEHAYGGSKTGDWGWSADSDFFKSVADFNYKPTKITSTFSTYLFDLSFLLLWSAFTQFLLIIGTRKMQVI